MHLHLPIFQAFPAYQHGQSARDHVKIRPQALRRAIEARQPHWYANGIFDLRAVRTKGEVFGHTWYLLRAKLPTLGKCNECGHTHNIVTGSVIGNTSKLRGAEMLQTIAEDSKFALPKG